MTLPHPVQIIQFAEGTETHLTTVPPGIQIENLNMEGY